MSIYSFMTRGLGLGKRVTEREGKRQDKTREKKKWVLKREESARERNQEE